MDIKPDEMEILIKSATEAALRKLMMHSAENPVKKGASGAANKRVLILLPDIAGNIPAKLQLRYADCEMTVAACSGIEITLAGNIKEFINLNDESSRKRISKEINAFDKLISVSPKIKQMEAIASADDSGFAEALIIYFLLHKKSVSLLIDYDINDLTPSPLTKKIKELLANISAMGIAVETLKDKTEAARNTEIEKELITEKTAEEIWNRGAKEIIVGKGCIVTPLAKDKLNELGIEIKYCM